MNTADNAPALPLLEQPLSLIHPTSLKRMILDYATAHGLACYEAGRASRDAVAVPEEIRQIAARLHTQDNRITDNPLFAVQQKRRFVGVDSEYADASVWISEGCEVDAEEAARLDALLESGETVPADCQRMGYIDRWEFVTGCFTEQGCKDYIARNGHNLHEPRIYAYGSYRNAEFIALRKWLMSLADPTGDQA